MTNLELKLIATDRNEDITDACMDKLNSDIQKYNDDIADVDDEMLRDILEELATKYTDNKYTFSFTVFRADDEYLVVHEAFDSDYHDYPEVNYFGYATITTELV